MEVPTELQEKLDSLKVKVEAQAPAAEEVIVPVEGTPAPVEPVVTPPTPQNTEVPVPAPVQEKVAPAPQKAEAPKVTPDPWEQRYRVVDGKYKAETRDMRNQIAEKDAAIEELKKQLAEKQAVPAPAPAPAPVQKPIDIESAMQKVSEADVRSLVTPQLIEDYGMEYWRQQLALNQALAPQAPTPQVQPEAPAPVQDETRIDNLERQLKGQMETRFYSDLASIVPDYEDINAQEGWYDWLGEYEPLTGRMYDDLLKEAQASLDPVRVANLFDRYKATLTPSIPSDALTDSVEAQVVPDSSGPASIPDTESQVMSLKQWEREMKDLTRGELAPEAAKAKQAKLMALAKNNLVRG